MTFGDGIQRGVQQQGFWLVVQRVLFVQSLCHGLWWDEERGPGCMDVGECVY